MQVQATTRRVGDLRWRRLGVFMTCVGADSAICWFAGGVRAARRPDLAARCRAGLWTLARLERDGLVEAAADDGEGHAVYRLTDAGRAATLAAVGAAPRTRPGIAAAYAVVVALIGAVLGALVGLVPGIAVTYPLTSGGQGTECFGNRCVATGAATGPFLDIPWVLIVGVVIGLPLLMAGVVAATTRGRLPLVARLD